MITIESDSGMKLRLGNRVAAEVNRVAAEVEFLPHGQYIVRDRYSAKRSEFHMAFAGTPTGEKLQCFLYYCGRIVRPDEGSAFAIPRKLVHHPRLGNITIGCQTFSGIHYEALKAWALGKPR